MKLIPLTKKQFTIVDDEDYKKFSKFKWYPHLSKDINSFYVQRNSSRTIKPRLIFMLHREIMNAPKGMVVDHINHNTLDNRKSNLRICSSMENVRNRASYQVNSTTKMRGVHLGRNKRWYAHISVNGRCLHLGSFTDINEAAKAYNAANIKYFGKYGGKLNE